MRGILGELFAAPVVASLGWDGFRPSPDVCGDARMNGCGAALEEEQRDGSIRRIA